MEATLARPTTASWTKFLVLLGDGAGPEVFTAPCALTSKGIALSADTADSTVGDCDDPDAPTWVERVVRSLTGTVTGSGLMAAESSATWRAWFLSGAAKNVRVKIDLPLADDGGYYAGSFVLTGLEQTGAEADGKIRFAITMLSDGEITWVPASS